MPVVEERSMFSGGCAGEGRIMRLYALLRPPTDSVS